MNIISYLKHVREEFAHIVWPSNRTAVGHTLVVIVIGVLITLLVFVLDSLFSGMVTRLAGS